MLLESSIMLLENFYYSTGIIHDNRHMMIKIFSQDSSHDKSKWQIQSTLAYSTALLITKQGRYLSQYQLFGVKQDEMKQIVTEYRKF
jgi:hypothetical protein